MIELRDITEKNFNECLSLKASVDNEDFVDEVTYSLAEAWLYYKETEIFAIYNDETIVGFVSMYVGNANCQIINFLIDDAYQKRGFGTEAAKICIDFLKNKYAATRISAPVDIRNTTAQMFWEKLGFSFSDSIENGYVFMRLFV